MHPDGGKLGEEEGGHIFQQRGMQLKVDRDSFAMDSFISAFRILARLSNDESLLSRGGWAAFAI